MTAYHAAPRARRVRRTGSRRGLVLATVTSALALVSVAIPTPPTSAQETEADSPAEPARATTATDASIVALERALDRRMTVWRTDNRVVYVRHCRTAHGGCPNRVSTFARLIGSASHEHTIDPFLLAAVAVRESGMNPLAAGAAGERGIVQLHPRGPGARVRFVQSEAYRRYCERQPGVCQDEVLHAGARLLSRSIDRCGGVREALGAYNRGACGETDYSRRVMEERQRLLRLAKNESPALASIN